MKRHQAPKFSAESFASRQGYADAKTDFIERVIAAAAWGVVDEHR
jgi:hypothetical protein